MTIAVCCTLADGVVLGTDSAITVTAGVQTPTGIQATVLKVYNEAEKVFGIHVDAPKELCLPVGLVTYGLATLGSRTLQSYVREFELENPPSDLKKTTMEELCRKLHGFFRARYVTILGKELQALGKRIEEVPPEQRVLAMFVGGFSPDQPLPEAWEVNVHLDERPDGVKRLRAPGEFGANWGGQFMGVQRFHKGWDPQAINALVSALVAKYRIIDPANAQQTQQLTATVQNALAPFEYQVPYAAMPIQEGIDYTTFLLDLMILQHRFVIGAPTCGGSVRVAVIRKSEGFQWVAGQRFELRRTRYA